MAKVSLDGIRIEVEHTSTIDDAHKRLHEFAEDLANNKFQEWGVKITEEEGAKLILHGHRDGTHFDAEVTSDENRAVVLIQGTVEINVFKLTLAGGADGLRQRVTDTIQKTLRDHLT